MTLPSASSTVQNSEISETERRRRSKRCNNVVCSATIGEIIRDVRRLLLLFVTALCVTVCFSCSLIQSLYCMGPARDAHVRCLSLHRENDALPCRLPFPSYIVDPQARRQWASL